MRRRSSFSIAILLVALACAAPQWHREGGTPEQLEADERECWELSGNSTGVSNLKTSRFVARCLAERGWVEGPAPSAPSPTAAPPAAGPTDTSASRLSFDECFDRCRELTDRSKEACFDVRLAAK